MPAPSEEADLSCQVLGVRKIKIKTTLHASSYPLRKPLNSLAHLKHVRTNVIQATGESHATKK